MMSSDPAHLEYKTSDIQLAVVIQADPSSKLEGLDGTDPRRIAFIFSGIPKDYHIKILRGEIVLNAKDVMQAQRVVHDLIMDTRRESR